MTRTDYAGGGIGLGPRPPIAPAEAYPAPVITSRDGVPGPVKSAVVGLIAFAIEHGWTVGEPTYAKGCFPHAVTARPGAAKESLAVRMMRDRVRAAAVYVASSSWGWETLSIWSAVDGYRRFKTLETFKDAMMTHCPRCGCPDRTNGVCTGCANPWTA